MKNAGNLLGLALCLGFAVSAIAQTAQKPLCDVAREAKKCDATIVLSTGTKSVKELFGLEYVQGATKKEFIGDKIDQCLLEMLACDESINIATALTAATQASDERTLPTALPPSQQFFLGLSFYRLQLETRSHVLRCAFGSRSKAQLRDYLTQAKQHTDQGGNPLSLDLNHIQGAVNMLKVLDAPNDCPEAPLTLGEISSVVREYTASHIKTVFTQTSQSNPVSTKLKQIYALIQSFMSAVAEVENAVQLLDVELLANNNKLQSIANGPLHDLYCNESDANCKAVAIKVDEKKISDVTIAASEPQLLLDARAQNRIYSKGSTEINKVEKAIGRLIGSAYSCFVENNKAACSPSADSPASPAAGYQDLRLRLTSDAYFWAEQATRQDNILTDLLADTKSKKSSFTSLFELLKTRNPEESPMEAIRQIQKTFENQVGADICPEYNKWYCCQAYPNQSYCQINQGSAR